MRFRIRESLPYIWIDANRNEKINIINYFPRKLQTRQKHIKTNLINKRGGPVLDFFRTYADSRRLNGRQWTDLRTFLESRIARN